MSSKSVLHSSYVKTRNAFIWIFPEAVHKARTWMQVVFWRWFQQAHAEECGKWNKKSVHVICLWVDPCCGQLGLSPTGDTWKDNAEHTSELSKWGSRKLSVSYFPPDMSTTMSPRPYPLLGMWPWGSFIQRLGQLFDFGGGGAVWRQKLGRKGRYSFFLFLWDAHACRKP